MYSRHSHLGFFGIGLPGERNDAWRNSRGISPTRGRGYPGCYCIWGRNVAGALRRIPQRGPILKFKLDENLGTRTQQISRQTGHDVETIYGESLFGSTVQTLYTICQEEKRCLVTLDLDFSNVLRFPPPIKRVASLLFEFRAIPVCLFSSSLSGNF